MYVCMYEACSCALTGASSWLLVCHLNFFGLNPARPQPGENTVHVHQNHSCIACVVVDKGACELLKFFCYDPISYNLEF